MQEAADNCCLRVVSTEAEAECEVLPGNQKMPYVNIQITRGATKSQKAELVREVIESLVRVLGKKPEHIHVVIQEINEEDWGFAGQLTDDWKESQIKG